MYRPLRALPLGAAASLLALSCASPSTPTPAESPTPSTQNLVEQRAVAQGLTILATGKDGPRLVKATTTRPAQQGTSPAEAAREHLAALSSIWLDRGGAADLEVTAVSKLPGGATIVSLRQRVGDIEIEGGELRVLLTADQSLAGITGTVRSRSIAEKGTFRRDARDVVARALNAQFGIGLSDKALGIGSKRAGFQQITTPPRTDLTIAESHARPVYLPATNGLVRAWSVEFIASKGLNRPNQAMRYTFADASGKELRRVNLTSHAAFQYRVFADATAEGRPLEGPIESFFPHPTGTPDGSHPDFVPSNLVTMDGFNTHRDPWLDAGDQFTQGNNVFAYQDWNNVNAGQAASQYARVSAAGTFDHAYSVTTEPMANATQVQAAIVNLFYMVNWLHDWYYDAGFDEAAGNAQLSNYDRGGSEQDPLQAQAQDDAIANGERNNANMSTPSDGFAPRMQMYLWRGPAISADVTLAPAGDVITAGAGSWGPHNFDLTDDLALAGDGVVGPVDPTHPAPGTVTDGCEAITTDVTGKIALIDRGYCAVEIKVRNAQTAGAVGVVLANTAEDLPGFGQAEGLAGVPSIPWVVVRRTDGVRIKAAVAGAAQTIRLHVVGQTERDGDIDNMIVAHEWGHYFHHRLNSCEYNPQCNAMSEGWGDFVAMHLMLRSDDNKRGTFSMSQYAGSFEPDSVFYGIRRYPYSVERATNPLSFRHLAAGEVLPTSMPNQVGDPADNPEPHNAGEVWAQMLWDSYVALLEAHPYEDARRRMSNYMVAGLKMTPGGETTYLEGRDGILLAAGAIDPADAVLIAQAFAARGAGTCAVGPAGDSEDFVGIVESTILAGVIATGTPTLIDDGLSCDDDGFLDAGESGVLRLPITNAGPGSLSGIAVVATTTTAGVILGEPTAVADMSAFGSASVEIPVELADDAAPSSTLAIEVALTATGGCSTAPVVVTFNARTGIDDVASSATDAVEAPTTAWTRSTGAGEDIWGRVATAADNTAWKGTNAGFPSDTSLTSPVLAVGAEPFVVTFDHQYALEGDATDAFYDGGVIEVTSDGGTTWVDVEELGLTPGYAGVLFAESGNPLGGHRAFSGISDGYPAFAPLALDFGTRFANQSVQLRFRIGTDGSAVFDGWTIDNIQVAGITNTPFFVSVAESTVCSEAQPDAGTPDAGTPDAGTPQPDAGGNGGDDDSDDGCGCRTTSPAAAGNLLLPLAAAVLALRRRRKRS
jgi:MYXO-CTERM domain-containing protein